MSFNVLILQPGLTCPLRKPSALVLFVDTSKWLIKKKIEIVRMQNNTPVAMLPCWLAKVERDELDQQVELLKVAEVVEESQNTFSATAFLVKNPGTNGVWWLNIEN